MDFLKSAIHVIVFQEYDLEYENDREKNEEGKKEEGEEKKIKALFEEVIADHFFRSMKDIKLEIQKVL